MGAFCDGQQSKETFGHSNRALLYMQLPHFRQSTRRGQVLDAHICLAGGHQVGLYHRGRHSCPTKLLEAVTLWVRIVLTKSRRWEGSRARIALPKFSTVYTKNGHDLDLL